uniref:Vav guanine nucleotide exchange factor 3 n=1 Tax=Esox lucius TaxID=8010 RepID=A0A6Q2XF55_ESOLU
MMEYWRQCALWLINCKVLPPNHRVTWESAQVFDLAQTLRDGVLLCQLLNNLRPQSINLKEINLRPQMSQFLCLKNIRTFLSVCGDTFGMKKSELFEAFDLFDVRDFGKVSNGVHSLFLPLPFPSEESLEEDEDIYNHLEDLIDENGVEDEEDLYDCVYDDEDGGEIYEDLMKAEAVPPPQVDVLSVCLTSIRSLSTTKKGTFPKNYLSQFVLSVFPLSILFLVPGSLSLSFSFFHLNIWKHSDICSRLLIYGKYCSHVETAIVALDDICKNREDVRMKLEECAKRANYGKFTLRDLLVVPMQRVLKYHLLLQELVKHTHDAGDKSNLRLALDAMKDLAQYVNEVKRDNETLRDIAQYQKSIENLNQSLSIYGRPKGDGEVRVTSVDKRAKQDRHIFLFDAAVIICKRRGDNYEMKEVIDLHNFKITNNPTSDKDNRKWTHGFYLTHNQGQSGFEFFFKTKELKKKWLEQFGMAIVSTPVCLLLSFRGIFNQGYMCSKCGFGAHKECLGRFGGCGKTGLPKMLVTRNYFGVPNPVCGPPLNIQQGDIIELVCADLHSSWWQGKILTTREVGFFPSDAVKPCPCVTCLTSQCLWVFRFAGPMERLQAEAELINRGNSTYLVRHRSREFTEYAISIKYNNDVKHIKILTREGCFHIAENKKFRSILELIEYYKHHSLREGFRSLDTTLQFPYREQENATLLRTNRPGGNTPLPCGLSYVCPAGYSFVPPSSAPFWSVFTPKVIGVAIARYDFSSRDTRELSLQEGDVVKIYTKTGANGWWRGEVSGRVSAPRLAML